MTEEFKKEMRDKFIPAVEVMLKKEIEHKKTLMTYYKRTRKMWLLNDTSSIEKRLINSYCQIKHMTQRILEYKKFVK